MSLSFKKHHHGAMLTSYDADGREASTPSVHHTDYHGYIHQVLTSNRTTLQLVGMGVVEALERVCKHLGYPKSIRVDQGLEFISKDFDLWAYKRGVILDFSRPGKPTDDAFVESLNDKFRAE